MGQMTPRERVMTAWRRGVPDRVPKHATFSPHQLEVFREKTGADDPQDYFGMEIRGVDCRPPREKPDFSPYLPPDLPEGTSISEWGRTRVPGPVYHFTLEVFPLADMTDPAELEDYPFPDYTDPYRWEGVKEEVEHLHRRGFFVLSSDVSIFEQPSYLRGLDRLLADLILNPEFAEALLDKFTEVYIEKVTRFVEAGVDGIGISDDVGMQDRMQMSPSTWRRWLKPRLARLIEAARVINPDIIVTYHSDGYIEPIIPELAEVGVDVLNPVQPECMDPAIIKKRYGDRLAFWGGMGIQHTMPFGTAEDVRQEVKHLIETLGAGGGFLIAPTHVLEPEVPWENIVAFFEAIEEFGAY